MFIGIPNLSETTKLVAATPDTVQKLLKLGYEVRVEAAAGLAASFPDQQYLDAGAEIAQKEQVWQCDIVLALDSPRMQELDLMKPKAILLARLNPRADKDILEQLASRQITGLAMDMVPRISRAQSMDALSSMANLAGYRAVIEAAANFGRLFSGQVTAAGKIPPATVYVIGAGVAGLAAIGAASSMGAIVNATDVRGETAEQVQSMGANFIAVPVTQDSHDGYARELNEDEASLAARLYAEQAAISNIVITTANIPGKKSPILLDSNAVSKMQPGSVIVDLAAANGGNCELTVPGEVITTENGVKIVGTTDYPALLPAQASQLYGQNLVNFLKLATPDKNGQAKLDESDEIIRQMLITRGSEITFPPPEVKVSSATPVQPVAEPEAPKRESKFLKYAFSLLAALILSALVLNAPAQFQSHFVVFALAVIVGFYVITAVTHALHTPLMSVTNAISGIIIVGALLQLPADNWAVKILALIAIVVASINIFGGFLVTSRMLKMFQGS